MKHLPFDVRGKAKEIHMTPGLQNHLLSTNKFTEENYVQIFDNKEVNIYDANDAEIRTTRGAVLKRWKAPKEGLWRFPIVDDATRHGNQNTTTAMLKHFPQDVLKSLPPPTKDVVNNVYEIKNKTRTGAILPRGRWIFNQAILAGGHLERTLLYMARPRRNLRC